MAVGFKVKYYWYQIGHGDFLHSFFSTINHHLEQNGWGTEYPFLLNELYNGKLENKNIDSAITELEAIKKKLQNYSPSQVIWDIEDLSKRPPWGDNISKNISNLSNYFITSEGEDLIDMLMKALEKGLKTNSDVYIESL
ncbi:immunity 70 family protein [Metabacillus fastidiosus]|uniref:Immunity 70 family protein n=1 Tax=Metabacillus fastidiosus TaxID=1458 RepID=A0ABU6NWT4_9BACI|nr:immunity 70 family protein [Metabacillus fastidiosus]MED4401588.1 immunity 70 family protein [Metabacillus fastidiosus]MED4463223.1 immunity 70 family protein [Metabacillus fastidiosus]